MNLAARSLTALLAAAVLATLAAPAAQAAPSRFDTGIADVYSGPEAPLLLARTRAAGASVVRLFVGWRGIAPGGSTKPAGFDATNPADPHYDWSRLDSLVVRATAAGLKPLISIESAPEWASESGAGYPSGERIAGTFRPNAHELGLFATALTRRYSGSFAGLPRVRYWQAWNEPNHHKSLNPQFAKDPSRPATRSTPIVSPGIYRGLLTAFSDSAHRVSRANVVIAGGLGPFFRPQVGNGVAAPFPFARKLLCMSRRNRPLHGCAPIHADAWAVHPYTSGGPTHHALSRDDLSLGDLARLRRLLRAAVKYHHLIPHGRLKLWVTEISWDSKPPDRFGLPVRLEARWIPESMYRVWRLGFSLYTWYQVRDLPNDQVFQSGLYFRCHSGPSCDRPKPALAAFRFPFVAFKSRRGVLIWGVTPKGRRGRVIIQQKRGRRWVKVARLRTNRHGIFFKRRLRVRGQGSMRARLVGSHLVSRPFSLRRVPDRPVNPFGELPPNEEPKRR